MKDLNAARHVLSQGITKSQDIASALQRCEYARTRRDFVNRVTGVVEHLSSGTQIAGPQPKLALVAGRLVDIQRKTDGVMKIMTKRL
jgi:hypothetical protein